MCIRDRCCIVHDHHRHHNYEYSYQSQLPCTRTNPSPVAPSLALKLCRLQAGSAAIPVSYTHLRAHETVLDLVCRLLLDKKKHNMTMSHSNHSLLSRLKFTIS
eukprot:TRINITY_DN7872_c0_g1_i1.p1 TRINITY_DN7872_c0_g1~~TRINITY_DN7872_c0_g1_i1.p1  ORF type:complete len:103 (+),score=24.20 TRINITY_DN7872_c0_g1_i1:127-435(+)